MGRDRRAEADGDLRGPRVNFGESGGHFFIAGVLTILLAGLTIIFLLAVATLEPFAIYANSPVSTVILIALLVCLIPTTIGGLLVAIGIAGMDRVTRFNVLAMSGRAVEAAGDVDMLLLGRAPSLSVIAWRQRSCPLAAPTGWTR